MGRRQAGWTADWQAAGRPIGSLTGRPIRVPVPSAAARSHRSSLRNRPGNYMDGAASVYAGKFQFGAVAVLWMPP